MVFVPPKDRVLEKSTSNSQTVFTVTGAADTSYNAFSASMSVNDTTIGGVIERGVAFKSGLLTYSASNQVTVSQAYDSKGTFSASGVKEVFMGLPAAKAVLVVRGHIAGLTLSTAGSSATFGVASGEAADSTAAERMVLASAYTKTTAAWAVGTGNGSFDGTGTGPSAAAGWYHVYLIKRLDTGVVDILTSASATAPTMPTSYTLFRRIGAMKTNGSFQWIAFTQIDDTFWWTVPTRDVNTGIIGTTATLITLTVPTSVVVNGIFTGWVFKTATAGVSAWFYPPFVTDQTVAYATFANVYDASSGGGNSGTFTLPTNTSGQLKARGSVAGATIDVDTFGWVDTRGRLS